MRGAESIVQKVLLARPSQFDRSSGSLARELTRDGDGLPYEIGFPFSAEAAA